MDIIMLMFQFDCLRRWLWHTKVFFPWAFRFYFRCVMLIWIVIVILLKGLSTIVPVLLAVAFLTLFERKLMLQCNVGEVLMLQGCLGYCSHLLMFEINHKRVRYSYISTFIFFCYCTSCELIFSIYFLSVIPFSGSVLVSDINPSILFIFAISSMGVYTIILAVGQVILNMRFWALYGQQHR